jgi:hypothetical protein
VHHPRRSPGCRRWSGPGPSQGSGPLPRLKLSWHPPEQRTVSSLPLALAPAAASEWAQWRRGWKNPLSTGSRTPGDQHWEGHQAPSSLLLVPDPISFTLLHHFTITRIVYFLTYYYCFPLDTLIPLFTANRWDWQPHRNVGSKVLGCVVCRFHVATSWRRTNKYRKRHHCWSVTKLASITFLSLAFSY